MYHFKEQIMRTYIIKYIDWQNEVKEWAWEPNGYQYKKHALETFCGEVNFKEIVSIKLV